MDVALSIPVDNTQLRRSLEGLAPLEQERVVQRYQRLLPVLHILLRRRDIYERNRAWPGVRPIGKEATTYLSPRESWRAREIIIAYAAQNHEDADILWELFYAYCRYGPIGLADACTGDAPITVPQELQACAHFHRLAKHPRSDAGHYIRELLRQYADALDVPPPPDFLARYLFATDRRLTNWFTGEHTKTAHLVTTTRRLNRDHDYPHKCWFITAAQLPFTCRVSDCHATQVQPWLTWAWDRYSGETQGFVLTASQPTMADMLRCYRWSIWHYGAPWWPTRGAPEALVADGASHALTPAVARALTYTHCRWIPPTDQSTVLATHDQSSWYGLPDSFTAWIDTIGTGLAPTRQRYATLAEIRGRLLDHFQELTHHIATQATPAVWSAQAVSLPWSDGIAAALLLPSAGTYNINGPEVQVFGVPYQRAASAPSIAPAVYIRCDPDDARIVYLVHNHASVEVAYARDFEHCAAWTDLVDDRAVLAFHHD